MNSVKVLANLFKTQKKPSGSDYTATVTRVDGNTAYVQLTGSEITDTPVSMTVNASPGDKVRVRIANGKAWLTGSDSAPPTNDAFAKRVSAKLTEEIESTNVVVRAVDKVVQAVKKIADNTNQYFWHTESGADTGAHITEIPQDEFLADPEHGGGNLLARSNGIAVRDGLLELATFSADGEEFNVVNGATVEKVFEIATKNRQRHSASSMISDYEDAESDWALNIELNRAPYGQISVKLTSRNATMYFEAGVPDTKTYEAEAVGITTVVYDGNKSFAVTQANGGVFSGDTVLVRYEYYSIAPYFTFGDRTPQMVGEYSVTFGKGLVAYGDNLFVIGKNNKMNANGMAFVVGNGSSEAERSDALTLTTGGALEVADPATTRLNLGFDSGTIVGSSVAANSYYDLNVTFNKTFAAAPNVVAGFVSNSTGADMGSLSCSVHTITTTGCTVRIFNNSSSARTPYITWIAVG